VKKAEKSKRSHLTTAEVARHCQVTVPTVKRWIGDGRLIAFRTPGGHSRIDPDAFRRFLAAHGMPPYPAAAEPARVLVVDDSPALVDVVVNSFLASGLGVKLEAATDGYEALIKVGSFQPDLIVLDAMMPLLDGVEVCRRLRASPATRGIRILGLTGHPEIVQALLQAGADRCLTKPSGLGRVAEEAGRLLALPSASDSPTTA
jgi:excisionase family DNA binding protein